MTQLKGEGVIVNKEERRNGFLGDRIVELSRGTPWRWQYR